MLKVTTKAEKMEGHLAGFTISSLYIQENYLKAGVHVNLSEILVSLKRG